MIYSKDLDRVIVPFPELGINFWALTKTGSTAVLQWLFSMLGKERGSGDLTVHAARGRVDMRLVPFSNWLRNVATVRDPRARFMSGYKDLFGKRRSRAQWGGMDPDWSRLELLEFLAGQSSRDIDIHFKPQTWVLRQDLNIALIRIERFHKDWVEQVCDPPCLALPHSNVSGGGEDTLTDAEEEVFRYVYSEDIRALPYPIEQPAEDRPGEVE